MQSGKTEFWWKIEDGAQYESLIRQVTELWQQHDPVESPLKHLNSHQYTLYVLAILKNELNTYSNSLIAAALGLHRFFYGNIKIEKNPVIEQIINDFVEIKRLPTHNIARQPDEYRAMLLNVAQDLRAVIIQIAINLFELRQYQQLNNAQQQASVLDQCEFIYIPLAHRLGLYKIKSTMEDLVLQHRNPEDYQAIAEKLKESEHEREQIIKRFIRPIEKELETHGMKFRVKSRTKSIHSIHSKMGKQNVPFEKVFDLWAVRIIIDSKPEDEKADCWHAYSVVTNQYAPDLARMRDWITLPRENGYESLHTTVKASRRTVEVQIRTERMDDEAENGMAAHWRYKGGKNKHGVDFYLEKVRTALETEAQLLGEDDFRVSKFSTELFAFTPNGDLKKLKIGATVLDFAFAVHTELALKCTGAIVNGKNVSLRHSLRNGDAVQILTSKNQKPSLDWLNVVTTNRAKLRIKKALDEEARNQAEQGKEIFNRRLKNWKIEFKTELLDLLIQHYNFKTVTDFYRAIYFDKIDLPQMKKVLIQNQNKKAEKALEEAVENFELNALEDESESTEILSVDSLDNINYSLAKCCTPIPGDPIFGFVTVGGFISIHRIQCPNAVEMRRKFPYRFIAANWKKSEANQNFKAEIFVRITDNKTALAEVNKVISNIMGIHIVGINLQNNPGESIGKITVLLYDLNQLDLLIARVSQVKGVKEVYRHH